MSRRCRGCSADLDGTAPQRRWCSNACRCRAYYHADRPRRLEYQKARHIRNLYGLTPDEYNALIAKGCAICGTHDGKMCVDHCHESGQVRGALCSNCNVGLGMFSDDPERIRVAAGYLEARRRPSLVA